MTFQTIMVNIDNFQVMIFQWAKSKCVSDAVNTNEALVPMVYD